MSVIDVLLTHSYHLYFDQKQAARMQPYPPLGTLYAASILRRAGFSVAVFDTMLSDPNQFAEVVRDLRPGVVAVYEDDFNYLSKMCLTRMREVCWQLLEDAKSVGALTLAHGSDATDHAAEYLDRGFDAVLIGEAEATLLEIAAAKRVDETFQGVAVRTAEGDVRYTDRRHSEKRLSGLPQPARDLIDIALYGEYWRARHGRFSSNMIASRGCPFRCNWCAKPIFGNRFQLRPEKEVVEEMRHLREVYGVEHIWFADDVFALDRHWTSRFAGEVTESRVTMPFKIQTRADLMTAENVDALAGAGCEEAWLGVESGSQKILDAMDKDLSLSEIAKGTRTLREAGIRTCYFLQLGYPGESWEDITRTIELVRQMRPDDIGVSISYPLPNTRFYDRVHAQLGTKRNWRDSDDLCVMFAATYRDAFYLAVRDALHAEVNSWRPEGGISRDHVAGLWQRVLELESRCRNPRPTFPVAADESFVPVSAVTQSLGGK